MRQYTREDCDSINTKNSGLAVVCARVTQKVDAPFGFFLTIKDQSGQLRVEIHDQEQQQQIQAGDCALFLFDCAKRPFEPERITTVPPEFIPFAQFQLRQFREKRNQQVFESSQSARSIELIFEQSGAVLRGPAKSFRADCIWYRPKSEVASLISGFYLLHHSNFPDSAFIINANKPPVDQPQQRFPPIPPRATADRGFELQLDKFQSAGLTADTVNKFEVVGNEYELKDFRLRVGTVTYGGSVKGVIVELEFAASNIVVLCQQLLQELLDSFFPGHTQKAPEVLQRQSAQPDNYTPIDTAQQYLDIFAAMQKRSS